MVTLDLFIGFSFTKSKAEIQMFTFNIDKSQRFYGSHAVLSHTGIRARVLFTQTANNQLTVAINLVILDCGKIYNITLILLLFVH